MSRLTVPLDGQAINTYVPGDKTQLRLVGSVGIGSFVANLAAAPAAGPARPTSAIELFRRSDSGATLGTIPTKSALFFPLSNSGRAGQSAYWSLAIDQSVPSIPIATLSSDFGPGFTPKSKEAVVIYEEAAAGSARGPKFGALRNRFSSQNRVGARTILEIAVRKQAESITASDWQLRVFQLEESGGLVRLIPLYCDPDDPDKAELQAAIDAGSPVAEFDAVGQSGSAAKRGDDVRPFFTCDCVDGNCDPCNAAREHLNDEPGPQSYVRGLFSFRTLRDFIGGLLIHLKLYDAAVKEIEKVGGIIDEATGAAKCEQGDPNYPCTVDRCSTTPGMGC